MSKKTIIIILILMPIISIFTVVSVKTLISPHNQISNVPQTIEITLDPNQAAQRLSKSINYQTVSYRSPVDFDYNQFIELHNYLKSAFPTVHEKLKVEKVNHYSLLYTWKGSDSSLKPLLLTAHMDVVGVEKETLNKWRYAPFSGEIAEGKIWGRGARDNKCQMLAALEAVEYLLEKGMQPKRTIILAFGHDEEVLGVHGARKIATILKSQKITPECVVDEGGAIVEKAVPGLHGKVALIATVEKGFLTVELSVNTKAVHSSTPEKETSIGILCKAISKLEETKFPATLHEAEPMLRYASSEMKFPFNMIFSNLWLTGGIVKKMLLGNCQTAAMLRTTIAPTAIEGGYQDNVIPASAKALLNIRLLPQDSVNHVIFKIKGIIDDPRVQIKKVGFYNNAPLPSSAKTESFKMICTSIKQLFPDAVCVPYFTTGGTDTKHYTKLTTNLYRFTPSIKENSEIGHGINERIPIENYMQYIKFYVNLIHNFDNSR